MTQIADDVTELQLPAIGSRLHFFPSKNGVNQAQVDVDDAQKELTFMLP